MEKRIITAGSAYDLAKKLSQIFNIDLSTTYSIRITVDSQNPTILIETEQVVDYLKSLEVLKLFEDDFKKAFEEFEESNGHPAG